LLGAAEGQVTWAGAEIHSLAEDYFSSVTFVGHRPGVKDELTAAENLRIGAGLGGIEIATHDAVEALEKVGLTRNSVPARLLSEGQRRRVSLARLVVSNTRLWLLDEILTSLDKVAVALVRSLIAEHISGGGIAIVATHQDLELDSSSTQRLELAT
jgi:heme exporter protein A